MWPSGRAPQKKRLDTFRSVVEAGIGGLMSVPATEIYFAICSKADSLVERDKVLSRFFANPTMVEGKSYLEHYKPKNYANDSPEVAALKRATAEILSYRPKLKGF